MTVKQAADACLFISIGLLVAFVLYLGCMAFAYVMQMQAKIQDEEDRS